MPVDAPLSSGVVRLRPMHASDLHAVVAIERRAHVPPWSEATLRECLRVGYACELIEVAGQPVAFSVVRVGPDDTELLNLCVAPDAQRRGHGRRLLGSVVGRARAAGSDRVLLDVRESNIAAIRLYTRSGFAVLGSRARYYRTASGGDEDAVVMGLAID